MSARVVVYASSGCQACKLTQQALEKAGVAFEVVDLETNPAARQLLVAMEFTRVPVVTTGREWWSGFQPDRIREVTRD